ncbi:hypothetical protein [Microbacterium sp. GXF7504]
MIGTRHDLTGNEARVLAWMALHALDNDARPRYFMGREQTAMALGYMVPDEVARDHPEHRGISRARAAAFRRVSEAISGLAAHRIIHELRSAHSGQRAEHELRLHRALDPVDKCPGCNRKGDGKRRPAVDGNRRAEGDGNRRERVTETVAPRNQEEPQEEKGPGINPVSSTISLAPVDEFEPMSSSRVLAGMGR